LGKRTQKLEKRMKAAEIVLNCLEAERTKRSSKAADGPLEKKTSMATFYGQRGGRYQCRASKTMLKFCITGVALAMLILMFISTEGHWLASTRATVIIKRTGQTEDTFTSVFEVMHEIQKDVMRAPRNISSRAMQPWRAPGEHAILMFLLCVIFLTAGNNGPADSCHAGWQA
jgi:hypothetical protein